MVGALDSEMERPRPAQLADEIGINLTFTGSSASTVSTKSAEVFTPHHRPLAVVVQKLHVCRALDREVRL